MSKKPIAEPEVLLPADIKDDLKKAVYDSLAGIFPPAQVKQAADRVSSNVEGVLAISMTKVHVGPMPPVEMAAGYEQLLPGSIDRMFKMAEKDQDAFLQSHQTKQLRDDRFRLVALLCGFLALGFILGIVVLLAYWGMEWLAGGVATIGAAGIIATFVNAGAPMKAPAAKTKSKGSS